MLTIGKELRERGRGAGPWRPYVAALIGALILLTPGLLNGSPLYFIDTQSYVRVASRPADALLGTDITSEWRRAEERASVSAAGSQGASGHLENKGVTGNRSVYYGVLALLSYVASGFWLLAFFQAYLCAIVVALPWFRLGFSAKVYLGTTLILAFFTPAGLFSSFIMPDLFAGLIIASSATLIALSSRLGLGDHITLWSILVLSCLVHNSHALILLSLLTVSLITPPLRSGLNKKVALVLCSPILIAFMGQLAFRIAVEKMTGSPPILLPHISAHLVDRGPGTDWLKKHCPTHELALCEFRSVLPTYWEDFLGSQDPSRGVFAVADAKTRRQISSEQVRFAVLVARDEPFRFVSFLGGETLRQLITFDLGGFVARDQLKYVESNWPAALAARATYSLAARHPVTVKIIDVFSHGAAAISLITCLFFLVTRRRGDEGPIRKFIFILVFGVVTNAAICGVLASPYARFQARVIWVITFGALIACVHQRSRRTTLMRPTADISVDEASKPTHLSST
jgi:hypothetical protein